MAFDAGMLACTLHEICSVGQGGRIERVLQPERDEIVLQMRTTLGGKRLLINAGSNNPRIGFTEVQKENPQQPPMFCMLLRKHLSGAKLCAARQLGFERVAELEFETRDEMGFTCTRYLIAEVMGKYSNLIFTDGDHKIMAVLKTVDFTTSSKRQVLPGMTYELPPAQNKCDPVGESAEAFAAAYAVADPEQRTDRWILERYMGISAAVAREIAYRATRHTDTPVKYCTADELWRAFDAVMGAVRTGSYEPTMVTDGTKPVEYAFVSLSHYGEDMPRRSYESAGLLLDEFFASRDRESRIKQRASDVLSLLTHGESRITKKLEAQRSELAECEQAEVYKKYGDLIMGNLYALEKGAKRAELVDYEDWNEQDGSYGTCIVELDERLTPVANGQKYYKKYTKLRNAKVELTKQIEIGENELAYLNTVFDALTRAETQADLDEIREELYRFGYASRMKGYAAPKKNKNPVVMQFTTTNGYRVLCGKNNVQNEYITHKVAERNDWWFHVKGMPGSHVVMLCDGEEPPAEDFTDAAEIAAYHSKAQGEHIAVDYIQVRHVKKPPAAKPGLVIYHTNWTAYVTPDEQKIKQMRNK